MDNWFTIEQIDRDTFSISEYKHWEETHCYLLCGEKYAILIDTGLGVSNIRKIVDSLTKLPVMTVTTHVHWDHIGGHKYFENIAVHEAEKDWLSVRFPIPLQVVKNNLTRLPCDFPRDFDISRYPTKNFTRWRFSKFRRAGNSSCSHAGTFSRTLLLLRTRTKLFVFRGFDIQGKPGRILPNYRPEAILSIYKANTEIQYKKSSARTPSVGYSRFFDSRY